MQTPSRMRRTPLGFGYSPRRPFGGTPRGVMRAAYGRPAYIPNKPSRAMRMIGLPSSIHAFKRPGTRVHINAAGAGSLPFVDGVVGGPSTSGTTITLGSLTTGTVHDTSNFGGSVSFTLNGCANVPDLINLFENYRISKVGLRFDLSMNQAPANGTAGGQPIVSQSLPIVHMCVDYDDAAVPTAPNDVLQHSNANTFRFGDQPLFVTCAPRAQSTIAVNPTTNAAGGLLDRMTWLDTGSANIQHYGVKFFFENMPNGNGFGLSTSSWCIVVTPTYYLEMKNVA